MLVRFADDLVMAFENFVDAEKVFAVLDKRLSRYGLTLHPDKTRFIDFRCKRPDETHHPAAAGTTFDFLGFSHVWGKSRRGKNVVRQGGFSPSLARALRNVSDWCRANRHKPIREQQARLSAAMRGHFAYYGISGNGRQLHWFAYQVGRILRKWLLRRDRQGVFSWSRFGDLLRRHPLPPPRIVHQYAALSEAHA